MYDVKYENGNGVCRGCLSSDRSISPLVNYGLYITLLNQNKEDIDAVDVCFCWECEALMRKIHRFQLQVQKADKILSESFGSYLAKTSLSKLIICHKQEYDAVIEETRDTLDTITDSIDIFDNKIKVENPDNFTEDNRHEVNDLYESGDLGDDHLDLKPCLDEEDSKIPDSKKIKAEVSTSSMKIKNEIEIEVSKTITEDSIMNEANENSVSQQGSDKIDENIDMDQSAAGPSQRNKSVVPSLQSGSDGEHNDQEQNIPMKKKRVYHSWVFVAKFDSALLAHKALEQENIWSVNYWNETEEGKKTYYRCNKVKKRGPQCSARRYILYDSFSDAVFLYRTEDDHNHESKESTERGLSEIVKLKVNELLDLHLKPRAIMTALSKVEGLKLPTMPQLTYYLNDRRRAIRKIRETVSR